MQGIQNFKVNVLKNKVHYVTSDYKTRNSSRPDHSGIDIVSNNGKNNVTDYIISPYDGIVSSVRKETAGGNIVEIQHSDNIRTLYAHLKNNSIDVKKGDKVIKGQVFAHMGSTGTACYGAHLHFSVYKNNKINDPLPYLQDESLYNPNVKEESSEEWTTGNYKLLVSKTIRTSTKLNSDNRVKVKQCMKSVKPFLTSQVGNDIAMYKVGSVVNITEIIYDGKRIWGKLKNCYIVLRNLDGTPQAKRVN